MTCSRSEKRSYEKIGTEAWASSVLHVHLHQATILLLPRPRWMHKTSIGFKLPCGSSKFCALGWEPSLPEPQPLAAFHKKLHVPLYKEHGFNMYRTHGVIHPSSLTYTVIYTRVGWKQSTFGPNLGARRCLLAQL